MDMGWVNPWVGLGWVGLGLSPNFLFCNGLGWAGPAENFFIHTLVVYL